MNIPKNIKKEHVLKAIEKIDKEKIPDNASSKFYDLIYNGKTYPPKLVLSYANTFVNGEALDRNTFDSVIAFKILRNEGFEIIEKVKIPKVKLYDFHGDSAINNAHRLLSENREWFYWDDSNFKKYIKGDVIFWLNRKTRKAIYTIVDETKIKPVFEDGKNYIRENGIEVYAFAQDQKTYENFYRFKVLQIVDLPNEWNYVDSKVFQNQLMSYILYENNIGDIEKRVSKINDLLVLFKDGEANQILNNIKELLSENNISRNIKLIPEIIEALEEKGVIAELNRIEFKYQLAQDVFNYLVNFTTADAEFYERLKKQISNFRGKGWFMSFLNSFSNNSEEFKFIKLIGELISYCDLHAANKKIFNKYEDYRTLANSNVRQNAWANSLLQFKIDGNTIVNLPASIKNALSYLIDPNQGSTMLSENHRTLFFNTFLNEKSYNSDTFISEYLNFFKQFDIESKVANKLNYTEVLDFILYRVPNVRKLWIDNTESNYKIAKEEYKINLLKAFQESTKSAGLIFAPQLIQRYIASLTTKPFVILSGLSGSGKTKLAQSFAMWLSEDESQYQIVPVGADWTNREPLFGYPNSLKDNEYVKPESGILDLILNALTDYNNCERILSDCKPYFLILDEMNLSHVERYFADILSAMESGDEIKLYSGVLRKDNNGNEIPNTIKLPPNLFIVGTVNIDETTYMFSPKVLDRANTIEFRINETDLAHFFTSKVALNLDLLSGKGDDFESEFMTKASLKKYELESNIKDVLKDYFSILKLTGAEFGYRTSNEMAILINNIMDNSDSKDHKAVVNNSLDIAIMQKLLPKLHGSRTKMIKILPSLCGLCFDTSEYEPKSILDSYLTTDFKTPDFIKYQISFDKICRMYKNAIENGFASYAEA
jgi:hypothetical protein